MKNVLLILMLLIGTSVHSQTKETKTDERAIIEHLPVPAPQKEPTFKVYELQGDEENWFRIQDVYNSLRAKVPGISILAANANDRPTITIRGDRNTVVIVDGVRYDISVLNTLNPRNIESVKVSADPAAATYFIGNQK